MEVHKLYTYQSKIFHYKCYPIQNYYKILRSELKLLDYKVVFKRNHKGIILHGIKLNYFFILVDYNPPVINHLKYGLIPIGTVKNNLSIKYF